MAAQEELPKPYSFKWNFLEFNGWIGEKYPPFVKNQLIELGEL